jgi:hypothetical protein
MAGPLTLAKSKRKRYQGPAAALTLLTSLEVWLHKSEFKSGLSLVEHQNTYGSKKQEHRLLNTQSVVEAWTH